METKIEVCLEEAKGIKEDLLAKGFDQETAKAFMESNCVLVAEGTGSKMDGIIKAGKAIGNFIANNAVPITALLALASSINFLRKSKKAYQAQVAAIEAVLGKEGVAEWERLYSEYDDVLFEIDNIGVAFKKSTKAKLSLLSKKQLEILAKLHEIEIKAGIELTSEEG